MSLRRGLRAAARVALVVVAASMPLLGGCGQLRSIDERAMVTGVALDPGQKSGGVEVTLQWYHGGEPAQAATGGGGGGGASVLLASRGSEGMGTADAVAEIQSRTDRQFNFGVTQIILVSEALARKGATPYLDYFWRKPEFSQLAQVIVVRGKASELLAAGGPSGTAFRLYEFSQTARAAAAGSIPIPFWRFLALSYATVQDPWAPLLTMDKGHFVALGTALFRGDRMTGELDRAQTAGLSWVLRTSGYQDLTATLPQSGLPLSLHVVGTSVARSIDASGTAHLRLGLTAEIQEGYGLSMSNGEVSSVESTASKSALENVMAAVRGLRAAGSDVMGFGEWLRERDPKAASSWTALWPRMPVAVDVTVHVRSGGRTA